MLLAMEAIVAIVVHMEAMAGRGGTVTNFDKNFSLLIV